MLKIEMENLLGREKEMFDMYTELISEINNEPIRQRLNEIRLQEDAHVRMVKDIISLMREYIAEA